LRSRRVGISTFYRLLHEHDDAFAALDAVPGIARDAGVDGYATCSLSDARAEMAAARRVDARMICIGEADYPKALMDIADPPPILWLSGQTGVLARPMVAIVGARNASSVGLRMARGLATDLAQAGYGVVSGLARGIDTAAHRAAMDSGTLAVMAGGVDVIYPRENDQLGRDLTKSGARLSEIEMGRVPQARHFPRRNRLISGLALGVVVIEAAAKSGSLITARNALDQGREVMAIPGHPFDARAAGGNMLIRDGATLVRNAQDVIDALPKPDPVYDQTGNQADDPQGRFGFAEPSPPAYEPPPTAPSETRSLKDTAALHHQILSRLSPAPVAEDQLIRDMENDPQSVSSAVTHLELMGRITRQAGGLLAKIAGGR
jgi:DNA processing protein